MSPRWAIDSEAVDADRPSHRVADHDLVGGEQVVERERPLHGSASVRRKSARQMPGSSPSFTGGVTQEPPQWPKTLVMAPSVTRPR